MRKISGLCKTGWAEHGEFCAFIVRQATRRTNARHRRPLAAF